MTFLLYHPKTKPTGQILGDVLQIPHGPSIPPSNNSGTLIRWGSRTDWQLDSQFDKTVNKCKPLKVCSDKLKSLQTLTEVSEVNVPIFGTDPQALISEHGYPILGRRFSHVKGKDINLILQKRDITRKRADYFTVYIPTAREFRIHVVNGEVIRVQGKFLDFPDQAVPHIRNFDTGYRFRAPRRRLKSDRTEMAIKAVAKLGLDFGAVDLLVDDNDTAWVLEVNSAPACSPLTLTKYAVALNTHYSLDLELDISRLDIFSNDEVTANEETEDDEEGGNQ